MSMKSFQNSYMPGQWMRFFYLKCSGIIKELLFIMVAFKQVWTQCSNNQNTTHISWTTCFDIIGRGPGFESLSFLFLKAVLLSYENTHGMYISTVNSRVLQTRWVVWTPTSAGSTAETPWAAPTSPTLNSSSRYSLLVSHLHHHRIPWYP